MQGPSAQACVVRSGMQIRALGFQPVGRLPVGGHVGDAGWEVAGRHTAPGDTSGGSLKVGGQGGVQVVVQEPPDRGVAADRVVGGGEGLGVFAEQVVQTVAARCGLGEQMLVIQLIKQTASCAQACIVERGGGVCIEAGARDQAEAAEQPLLFWSEVGPALRCPGLCVYRVGGCAW
jgi:hypothetical protein